MINKTDNNDTLPLQNQHLDPVKLEKPCLKKKSRLLSQFTFSLRSSQFSEESLSNSNQQNDQQIKSQSSDINLSDLEQDDLHFYRNNSISQLNIHIGSNSTSALYNVNSSNPNLNSQSPKSSPSFNISNNPVSKPINIINKNAHNSYNSYNANNLPNNSYNSTNANNSYNKSKLSVGSQPSNTPNSSDIADYSPKSLKQVVSNSFKFLKETYDYLNSDNKSI